LKETEAVTTAGDRWMAPFAEHLGVVDPDFDAWRALFKTGKSRVLLVEGDMDREYFMHLKKVMGSQFALPDDVEIVPYGGVGALKNTVLVKFMIGRFERIFITLDLDAMDSVKPSGLTQS
jgi:putative ATP-dependent endonuclease of OLD family